MSVNGLIELHGGKMVINVHSGDMNQIIPLPPQQLTQFIPGDFVTQDTTGRVILVERKEQAGIAIVRGFAEPAVAVLYIANLGPSCPYQPHYYFGDLQLKINDRLVIWFNADGTLSNRGHYSASPLDDAPCLLKMYSLYKKLTDITYLAYDFQKPLYTTDDIVNHNNLDTFTIDPATSEDFDDAISVNVEQNTVYIHIVDIASRENEANISEKAGRRLKERCLTLYLANEHTEHLLDPEIASDVLSLVANKERSVVTVKVILTEQGLVEHYDIYRSTIIVKNRWNYDEVSAMISAKTETPAMQYLIGLTNKRSQDVNYQLNLPSVRFHIDTSTGLIDSLKVESTNDESHTLVATAMILANFVVSKHLKYCQVSLPNRFHENLRGLSAPNFVSTGNKFVDSFILVKRYARACYAIDKKGHFGLGLTDYVHFTSPMRRYADVIVHRILGGLMLNDDAMNYEVEWMNTRATVVRSIQDLYTNWKVVRHIDSENSQSRKIYQIWITDVRKGGVLWFMPSMSLNGFAHVSTIMPKQLWYFDYNNNTLQGNYTKQIVAVGKQFSASVESIDSVTFTLNLHIHTDAN